MNEIAMIRKPIRKNGMDFGFVDSYNALLRMVVDHEKKWLYIRFIWLTVSYLSTAEARITWIVRIRRRLLLVLMPIWKIWG